MKSYLISFTVDPRRASWPRIFDDIISHDLPRLSDLPRLKKLLHDRTKEKYSLADFKPQDVVILNIVKLRSDS